MGSHLRRQNENFKEYRYRLYKNKDLYGLKNDDIGDLLNKETGNKWDESAYRKAATNYIEGYDDGYEKGFSDATEGEVNELLEEIDAKRDELYKQQVKTRDKLREYRATLRDEARVENLKSVFIECAERISAAHPLTIDRIPDNRGERVAVVQFADWHFGEIVNTFLNTYDEDVFDERIIRLTNDIITYAKLMNVKTLKVLNNGDLISGSLHVSTRVSESEDITYQTMYVAETIANMLVAFAKEIEEVEFYSVTDNHSRVNKNKKEHIEKESFSRFIPWHLKTRLRGIDNIDVIENKINDVIEYDIGMFDIFHEKALFSHGHNDKLPSMVSDLTLMTRVFPVAVFTGHLHRNFEDEMHSIDLIMSPSAVGSGEYSKSIRKSSQPRQKMTVYENDNGDVKRIATFLINL